MNEADGVLWDNDPFALPKTPARTASAMEMSYTYMQSAGVKPDAPEAVRASAWYPTSYADWLKKQ